MSKKGCRVRQGRSAWCVVRGAWCARAQCVVRGALCGLKGGASGSLAIACIRPAPELQWHSGARMAAWCARGAVRSALCVVRCAVS